MFIAMNRFRVKKGLEEAFEKVWLSRDSHLAKVPGFVEFPSPQGTRARGFYALCLPLGLAEQGGV
jgi:heme-degrading monooxygenase HmoA